MSNAISFTGINLFAYGPSQKCQGEFGEKVVRSGAIIFDGMLPAMRMVTGADNEVCINCAKLGTSETAANLVKLMREGTLTKELAIKEIQKILGKKSDIVITKNPTQGIGGEVGFTHPYGKVKNAKGGHIILSFEQFYNNVRGFIRSNIKNPKEVEQGTGRFALLG